jgi:exosome complex RNA-binding protein Csl4
MNGLLELIKTTRLTMTEEELRAASSLLSAELTERRSRQLKSIKSTLRVGEVVSFIDNSGKRVSGEVTKVKTKKALVRVGNQQWDVPMGMLSKTR